MRVQLHLQEGLNSSQFSTPITYRPLLLKQHGRNDYSGNTDAEAHMPEPLRQARTSPPARSHSTCGTTSKRQRGLRPASVRRNKQSTFHYLSSAAGHKPSGSGQVHMFPRLIRPAGMAPWATVASRHFEPRRTKDGTGITSRHALHALHLPRSASRTFPSVPKLAFLPPLL
jgi:hypothetical protein